MIHFSPAGEQDTSAIAALHTRSWQENYRGILSDHYLDNMVPRERVDVWQNRFRYPPFNQYIIKAVENETIIGFVCLYVDDDPFYGSLVDNLHVSAEYKQKGIGRKLLQKASECIMLNANNPKMYLWVFEKNVNARKFYERLGALLKKTETKENVDEGFSEVCLYQWPDAGMLIREEAESTI